MSSIVGGNVLNVILSDAERELIEVGNEDAERIPKAFVHRRDLATADLAGEVTTLGWDTTYVLPVAKVNETLKTSPAVPKTFDIDIEPDRAYRIGGTFGPWQIGLGGSGGILFFAIPITTGTMTLSGADHDLSNTMAYISLKLKYVPQKAESSSVLQLNDLLSDDLDRSDVDPAVVVQNLVFARGKAPSTYIRTLMIGALQEWFAQNISVFTYIFATVSLNERASGEDSSFQWIKPTTTGYGYFDGPNVDQAYFGILSMTDNRSAEGLSNQIGPNSIPAGSTAGFNISMPRYLDKVVLPGLVMGFPKASASSFVISADGTVIRNVKDIDVEEIRIGAIDYKPVIKKFVLQVVADEIQVNTTTITEISAGIRSRVESTTYHKIITVTKPDGSQTLDFKESRPAETTKTSEIDTWVKVTVAIVELVLAVGGGVAGKVIQTACRKLVACIVIAIVAAITALTPVLIDEVIAGKAAEKLPSIDLLVLNSTSPVRWPKSAEFKMLSATLNGAFQIGGELINPVTTSPESTPTSV
ncbi:hypothetical protein CH254_04600 [Rhodococcus sp. 06-412-2C]|uniref:TULIP family P47-like protein n=1 Tax=Rhodococcus sp. 06-412-2B TaxID=2022512 RepID=UPI000B9A3888|nr:TULIP family P47-like protein [Rhodococcus sp. 06-412-2B]OZC91763.1 hypothetical protein CH254_04600 [Rhodococcus sp. 06-412-2C]OZC92331.1 hypothetical protein CH279_25875 [Rhodococcus sp. 06-412-2B]